MTAETIVMEALSKVSYKGASFHAWPVTNESGRVYAIGIGFKRMVNDSRDLDSHVLFMIDCVIDTMLIEQGGADVVYRKLWNLVRDAEMHEAAEHFRVDGKLPYDPHASGLRDDFRPVAWPRPLITSPSQTGA